MRPLSIPKSVLNFNHSTDVLKRDLLSISLRVEKIRRTGTPLISIVIPAYNEGENILKTLSSLANTSSKFSIEIIVVNNNSTDDTEDLIRACGVNCVNETKQGITIARNAGLAVAKGTYIVNADADTIYPEHWIDDMVNPLIENPKICLTYGKFSFIPIANTARAIYFLYEYAADLNRLICKTFKEEALNVYGFNSACRREQCLAVNGFNHPEGTNEDGWLAIKLREKGFGKLHWVTTNRSIVWTTDRRVQIDGGILKATIQRLKKNVSLTHFKR